MHIKPLIKQFVLLSLIVGCEVETNNKVVDEATVVSPDITSFEKLIEESDVTKRLIQYSRGTDNNLLIYNNKNSYERLCIGFITDSHIDYGDVVASHQNVNDAIRFCNNVPVPIAAILEGGDILTNRLETKKQFIDSLSVFFRWSWDTKVPMLYTKGNHDLYASGVSPKEIINDKDWGSIWYDRAEADLKIVRNIKSNGEKSGYYYYDLPEWKVRIISVDCFDVDYSKVDEYGFVLYGGDYYIANEQFNWIVSSALNFDDKEEKDWGVIVFTHYYNPSEVYGTRKSPEYCGDYRQFNDMLVAFNKQSSYHESYVFPENHYYDLSVSADWSRYAGQEIKPFLICVLSGHQHADIYNNWDGVQHIVTANQFCGELYSDLRIKRIPGTRTQNLFDILVIDLKQRTLRIIRYGAGYNNYGEGGDRFIPNGLIF